MKMKVKDIPDKNLKTLMKFYFSEDSIVDMNFNGKKPKKTKKYTKKTNKQVSAIEVW